MVAALAWAVHCAVYSSAGTYTVESTLIVVIRTTFLMFAQNMGIMCFSSTNHIMSIIRIFTSVKSLHSTASKLVTSPNPTSNKHTHCC